MREGDKRLNAQGYITLNVATKKLANHSIFIFHFIGYISTIFFCVESSSAPFSHLCLLFLLVFPLFLQIFSHTKNSFLFFSSRKFLSHSNIESISQQCNKSTHNFDVKILVRGQKVQSVGQKMIRTSLCRPFTLTVMFLLFS